MRKPEVTKSASKSVSIMCIAHGGTEVTITINVRGKDAVSVEREIFRAVIKTLAQAASGHEPGIASAMREGDLRNE